MGVIEFGGLAKSPKSESGLYLVLKPHAAGGEVKTGHRHDPKKSPKIWVDPSLCCLPGRQVGPKIADELRACTPGDAENFAISRVIA